MTSNYDEPSENEMNDRDIAIIGMAGRFPGAPDLDAFWQNLREGVEGIQSFSDEELAKAGIREDLLRDPQYVKSGSFLEGVEDFDAEFFGYSAREAELLDPQQRLFLEHSWEALENSGYEPSAYEGLIGVYAGVAWNTYLLSNLTTHRELFDGGGAFQVFITSDKDFMPSRVSYKLNLRGPSMILQTSCSTSLVAVHQACLGLLNYESDIALAGGVTVKVPQEAGYHYLDGGLASPDGHCRAFDAKAAGTVFGSGVGVVVLKRLSEALEDGDCIRAVIRGSAVNNDGSLKVSYTAPSVEGQAEVIAAAQAVCGVDPRSLQYVEAHGTGTSLGDPIEVTALTKVFRDSTNDIGFCGLGSVKTNVGHLDAAAGVAGLIKTVLSLEHQEIPPSLHFETPNPAIDLDSSPFFVNAALKEWKPGKSPRRAGVSSFGVGGTNAHVILQEAPLREASGPSRKHQLLVVSARNETALEEATKRLSEYLVKEDIPPLADIAYTLRVGRATFRHRRAMVAGDAAEAAALLESRDPRKVLAQADLADARKRPLVFLLSGQGSQYPGMGKNLYQEEAVFRDIVDRCADLFMESFDGVDLRTLMFRDPGEQAERQLTKTQFAQPALFTLEVALATLWKSWGVEPAILLGHSLGEYAAACLAGVFSLEDGLRLVARRGALMGNLPRGAMLAVPLAENELAEHLPEGVSIAAINEASRCVASGPEDSLAHLEAALEEEGISSRRLHTAHAFHSTMMTPVVEPFRRELAKVELKPPQIPILSNLSGNWLTAEQATDPEYWLRQMLQPVRFSQCLALALEDKERILLEVGPGRTLATLAARHASRQGQPTIHSLRHPQDEDLPTDGVLQAYSRLWLAGLSMDPEALFKEEKRHRVTVPSYPFQRRRYWIEAGEIAPGGASVGEVAEKAAKQQDPSNWFYLPAWKPSLNNNLEKELPKCWLIFADGPGVARRVAKRLRKSDHKCVFVTPGDSFEVRDDEYVIRPDHAQDYRRLFHELSEGGSIPDAFLHAWSVSENFEKAEAQFARETSSSPPRSSASHAGITAFEAEQRKGFFSLLALIQALADQAVTDPELVVLGNQFVSVHSAEELRPEKTTALGLLRVLPLEHPQIRSRVVDIDLTRPDLQALSKAVHQELMAPDEDEMVALRGRHRFLPYFEPVQHARRSGSPPPPLRYQGCYLLTGGLEGNGYAMACELMRSASANLLLLETEDLPKRHEWSSVPEQHPKADFIRRIQVLESLGGSVEIVVGELDQVGFQTAMTVAEERFGRVSGLIHTAGTVGEKTFRVLRETNSSEAAWQFQPKVFPLYALEAVLREREAEGKALDFCLLLSSLASVLGGIAYGSYAAANSFLEAFVTQRNRSSALPWLVLSWDVWRFEDESEQITDLREDLAELAMSPAEGAEVFTRSLSLTDQVVISTADLAHRLTLRRQRINSLRGRESAARDQSSAVLHARPELNNAYVPAESSLEKQLVQIWGEFLGFDNIGIEDNFFELGGDSFVAVQVANRIQNRLEVDLPVAKLYQGLTIRALAELLAEEDGASQQVREKQLDGRRQAMSRRREFQQRRRAGRGA